MLSPRRLLPACLLLVTAIPCQEPNPRRDSVPAQRAAAPVRQAPLYAFEVSRMDGTKTELGAYEGKVLLLVNTASKCGLTPQYSGLQELQDKYGGEGFTVLAFPANDFGQQEPGTDAEIAAFCKEEYAVTFPVFAKLSVKGEGQAPLYRWLTRESPFPGEVAWNFQKYLVDRTGKVVARFDPRTKPQDAKVVGAIEAALRQSARAAEQRPAGATPGAEAIAAAQERARAEDKVVFVHFSADWCGWCKRLEAFLARPEMQPIFTASFVDVRVATDKMADGQALLDRHAQGKSTGIPFMVWLSADGEVLARSFDAKGGNIGYPAKPEEIEAFMQVFTKLARHATPEQVALVRRTFEQLAPK
jgi:glutathione peroxidase